MNLRIRKLVKQAELPLLDVDGKCKYGDTYFSTEKFAELIVKECADWIDRQDESRCPYGIDLLEHFGVEE